MRPAKSVYLRLRSLPAAALLLAFTVLPGAASASAPIERGASGVLSPRLAELAKPAVRSLPRAEQAARLSVARNGPGSLLRERGRVLVEVRFDRGVDAQALQAAGLEILDVSRRYRTVTAATRPADLSRLENVDGVRAVGEVLTPLIHGPGDPGPMTSVYTPCLGAETSEGDEQLRAAEARAKFEVQGGGVKVGILSDSFDKDPFAPTGAAEDVLSGDLPGPGNPCGHTTPVEVLEEGEEEEAADEGRAMAQIVHDLAPGAPLAFATAFDGELSFADNIRALAAAGAEAIVDDVSYFEEPFFQEGPVGVAVSEVTDDDVAYFSAAGNDNLIDAAENDIGSWEAPEFRDSGSCPAPVVALGPTFEPTHCMDFNPGAGVDRTFGITVSGGETLLIDLQWAEPWEGVLTDLDAFLLDPEGKELIAGSAEENVVGSQRPVEIVAWENESGAAAEVRLVINRFVGTAPRLKFILLQNGGGVTATEYPKSFGGDIVGPTIFGHNGGEDAMSIGAIRFNTTTAPETFSSRGPVTHYFGPADGITPAAPLGSPLVLAKPDVVATDGGANTFFGSCAGNAWRFFGTSAAAPHATAVAALEREAEPAADAGTVKEAQREAAVAVGAFSPAAVGSGLVDAVGALEQLGASPLSPSASPIEAPPPGPCLPPRGPASPPPSPPAEFSAPTQFGGPAPDTKSPTTFFRRRPLRIVRTRSSNAKIVFRFGSDEAGVTFLCRVDGAPFRSCPARFVRRFRVGSHVVRVVARDVTGNADATPAVARFRVKRRGD